MCSSARHQPEKNRRELNEVLLDMGLRIDAKKHGIDLMGWELHEE